MSEKEKERNASQQRESERELKIFSMRFDSTTSSFLNHKKKTESTKFQKVSTFRSKENVQKRFLSLDFCHVIHLQDLKSFVGQ